MSSNFALAGNWSVYQERSWFPVLPKITKRFTNLTNLGTAFFRLVITLVGSGEPQIRFFLRTLPILFGMYVLYGVFCFCFAEGGVVAACGCETHEAGHNSP